MPVLRDQRKTIELTLPVTKGKIWIYEYMLAKDSLEIDKIYISETDVTVTAGQQKSVPISIRAQKYYEAMDATLEAMVAKWNFTDENGNELEPTPENLKKLPKEDFDYLQQEIDKRVNKSRLTLTQKKN